jgi:uncharacterized protein YciI
VAYVVSGYSSGMTTFAILFHGQPHIEDQEAQQAAFAAYMTWSKEHGVTSHPFKGQPHMEGPAETATGLSGYGIFEAEDLEAAKAVAAACPHAQHRAVEVVEIMTMPF